MLFPFHRVAIALALFCCSFVLSGQFALPADKLAAIPVEKMPAQNNDQLYAAELAARAPGRPDHFAVPIPAKIRPTTHGAWTEEGGTSVWRTRISSPGAKTLNLGFSEFNLPANATLEIFSRSEHLGPYSAADNETHKQLWTPVIDGDELLLELRVPTAQKQNVQLFLTFVHHDFFGVNKVFSGSCNLDVICGEANGYGIVENYRDIIRSVARITIGGALCTGFLVNNVNQDGRPLFMTANHCGIGPGNAASVVAYWNYENSVCRVPDSPESGGNGNGSLGTTNSGMVYLAGYAPSDVTLLELEDPINPAADVFFAGWSAEATLPQDTLIGIHHPSGDEKRISFSFQNPYRAAYLGDADPAGNHLEIPDWDIGTTEGGSSGSPIFDRFKRVRGQLHGGFASCGNDDIDSYGYFPVSWDGGGTPASRIKDYLDPCGTGTLTMDGLDARQLNSILTAPAYCASSCVIEAFRFPFELGKDFPAGTNLSIIASSTGLTATLSTTTAAGGDQAELVVLPDADLSSGTYTATVRAVGGGITDDLSFTINLSVEEAAGPSPQSPENGAVDVAIENVDFSWAASPLALGYELELSTSVDFATVLESVMTTTTTFTYSGILDGGEQYFWRVRTITMCDPGEWSLTTFTTTNTACGRFQAENLPVEISFTGMPQVEATVAVGNAFLVEEMEVELSIDHTFLGDLTARLRSPAGTEIQLFNAISEGSCAGENMVVSFADGAALSAADFTATCTGAAISTTGAFQSAEPLATFNGEPAMGAWTLLVNDAADLDGGNIVNFNIRFCNQLPVEDLSLQPSVSELENCSDSNEASFLVLALGTGFTGVPSLAIQALPGDLLDNYTTDFNAEDRTLTVDFTSWDALPAGSYTLAFAVTNDDGRVRTALVSLQLGRGVAEVLLAGPEDAAALQEGTITFTWQVAPNATDYTWQYATTEDFATVAGERRGTATEIDLDNLPVGARYFWRVLAHNNCGTTVSEVREFRIAPAGIHDFGANRALKIYPNPVKGRLTVEAEGTWPNGVNGTLFDAAGRRLADYRMAATGRAYWDLGTIPAGVYYLRFTSLGTERTERLVVLP